MRIDALKTGLFYGTDTGNTEEIADKISENLANVGCAVEMHDISQSEVSQLQDYELLILGIPTWDFGGIQSEWDRVNDQLRAVDLTGKTVALFGLGDQFGYGDYFVDAMGWLRDHVSSAGGQLIGHWSTDGYDFEESRAANADKSEFCGLAIDEDQQFELTDQRIEQWVDQLVLEVAEKDAA
ncbi:Flavodoxin [BD1-7 clade bacterium]|uniref:Flavodoxin n=1 Tax=BD1-7 clade bacterium TaxID=2029982 RepID=A0A5S9NSG3_9GAMM|nr:Flavodoxin [BD1-7 clade bacterium]CAA0093577.1 Flavodoxin [BD1-7 clade bacterium]